MSYREIDHRPRQEWPWGQELDAVIAAPESHEVIAEDEKMRTLRVTILPGMREPMHTHQWTSVLIVDASARLRYHTPVGDTVDIPRRDVDHDRPFIESLPPEGLHAVENIDTVPYLATRIEVKNPLGD